MLPIVEDVPKIIEKRIVKDLNNVYFPDKLITPILRLYTIEYHWKYLGGAALEVVDSVKQELYIGQLGKKNSRKIIGFSRGISRKYRL